MLLAGRRAASPWSVATALRVLFGPSFGAAGFAGVPVLGGVALFFVWRRRYRLIDASV